MGTSYDKYRQEVFIRSFIKDSAPDLIKEVKDQLYMSLDGILSGKCKSEAIVHIEESIEKLNKIIQFMTEYEPEKSLEDPSPIDLTDTNL